jgi:hypothetical protein
MTKLTVKELEPLQNLIDEFSITKLEDFFINTNLTSIDKIKLVEIIKSISPIQKNYLDHLG